jgi:urea transporter
MDKLLAGWEARCASANLLRFIDVNLRGISQVMLQDPVTGVLFLAAIAWGSFAAGAPRSQSPASSASSRAR